MSEPYDRRISALAEEVALAAGIGVGAGVVSEVQAGRRSAARSSAVWSWRELTQMQSMRSDVQRISIAPPAA